MPEPATRSLTVPDTRTSWGRAAAATRAPVCTAMPLRVTGKWGFPRMAVYVSYALFFPPVGAVRGARGKSAARLDASRRGAAGRPRRSLAVPPAQAAPGIAAAFGNWDSDPHSEHLSSPESV